MLKIRADQLAALDESFVDEQSRRLVVYNRRHAAHVDPTELSDDVVAAAFTFDMSTDEELERLSDIFVAFMIAPGTHALWREAAMMVIADALRPASCRLDFVEKHILPRIHGDEHGRRQTEQE